MTSMMLLMPTTGHMSHMVTSHERKQKTRPAINTNQTYQFICDIDSIKYNTIHEDDPHEAEFRFN